MTIRKVIHSSRDCRKKDGGNAMQRRRYLSLVFSLVLIFLQAFPTLARSADTTPPAVSIDSPSTGTTYTSAGTITITASASDNRKVSKVEIYDNNVLKATDNRKPFTYDWSFTSVDNGTHVWKAIAYDSSGNTSTSNLVTLTVSIAVADTTPPTVSIPNPSNNTTYTTAQTVTIYASASDNVGVTRVDFYDGGTYKGTDTTSSYTYSWTFTSADNGTHNWTARAYDAAGNSSTSGVVSLSVNITSDTTPPSVPTNLLATAVSSSQVNLSWSPSTDTGGSGLAGYKVYRSVTQIGTTTATNYSNYGLSASTQYCYTVKAYDGAGNESAASTQACATTQGSVSSGAYLWAEQALGISATYSATAYGVAVDAGGNAIAVGSFKGSLDFGCGMLSTDNTSDIFIAKYSQTGSCQWSKHLNGSGSATALSVAIDGSSNIIVAGYFNGSVDFGGGFLTSDGQTDFFIAKYSSTGAYQWARCLGSISSGGGVAYSVETDNNGNILVTGYFNGSVNFGGGFLTSTGGVDIFIAKYSPTGAYLWAKRMGSSVDDMGLNIAVDNSGEVLVAGTFQGSVDFGGGSLISAGKKDIFVAKYSPNGAHLWSKSFGSATDDYAYGVAVDDYDDVVLTGTFTGTIDSGGGPMSPSGGGDIFLVKYSSSGQHIWSNHYGATSPMASIASAVGTDIDGNIVLTGTVSGNINFGSGYLLSNGSYDIFLAKFSPNGVNLWSKRFGGSYDDTGKAVTVDMNGDIFMGGYFFQSVDFGGGTLTSANTPDAFIAKFAP
jgi:Bacterial Ig domain/Fibronectin type III domain